MLTLRGGEAQPYITDNGNLILDLTIEGGIGEAQAYASSLKEVPGVCEHGLFVGMASGAIIGAADAVKELGSVG